jgi:hypothetical protein
MITVLAVGDASGPGESGALASFGATHPSVEVVTARGAEEALETLARNRRIDAVLILASPGAGETAALIAEEDPGAPPVFAPEAAGRLRGARTLTGKSDAEILEALLEALGK